MITPQEVCEVLRAHLGSALLTQHPDFSEFLAAKLSGYPQERPPFEELRSALEQDIFSAVHAFSQRKMLVQRDDGQWVRIALAEFADIADALMELIFMRLLVTPEHYREIFAYMNGNPERPYLSALKALYLRYGAIMPKEERALLVRILKEQYPKEAYSAWLSPEEKG